MNPRDLLTTTKDLVTVWLDRHDRPTDLHQNGEPTTYSTLVLGEPIVPPRDPNQPILITDSKGVYLTVVSGPRLERMPVLVEYPFRSATASLQSSTASLSEISEEIPAQRYRERPPLLTKSDRKSPTTANILCAWCREFEATERCKQCKNTYYCKNPLCYSGHWQIGQHYTTCVSLKKK
jgi:hypothetical protein